MFSDHLIHNAKLQSEWSRTKCYFLRQPPTAPIWIIITMILRCCIVPSHAVMMIISWRVSCNDAECDHYSDAPTPHPSVPADAIVYPQWEQQLRTIFSPLSRHPAQCHQNGPQCLAKCEIMVSAPLAQTAVGTSASKSSIRSKSEGS